MMAQTKDLSSKTTLHVWLSVSPEDQQFINGLIQKFEDTYPTIDVVPTFIPGELFFDQLNAAVASCKTPDVAALQFNYVLTLQGQGALTDLDIQFFPFFSDLLEDACQSNMFNGRLYALPWQRYSCSSTYLNLGVFKSRTEGYPERQLAAYTLLAFLVDPAQQTLAFNARKWYPTLQSLHKQFELTCPEAQNVVRIKDPNALSQVIKQVRDRGKQLQCAFEYRINTSTPVALLKSMVPTEPTAAAALANDSPDEVLYSAAVSLSQFTESELNFQLEHGIPIKIAALFVNQPTEDFPIDPGDYALAFVQDTTGINKGQALRVGDNKVFNLAIDVTALPAATSEPTAQIIENLDLCIYIFGRRYCLGRGVH